tara:strand:- start:174 stop:758 length:585 start_codon:yes stop_codon:yes gene_type:complete
MIPFKKFSDIANKVSKKLKLSKDKALQLIVKAQQKGYDPLKWQRNLSMLTTMTAEYQPKEEGIEERTMTSPQKLQQMQHYWDNLSHLATDEVKKKNMKMRFGIRNIKLDPRNKRKILSFEEDRDYKDEYKKFQSSKKMRKYRAELNKYNRDKGTYGNGDGKDASHKKGKIVGMEDQSANRGRAEKSRLVGSKRK